MSETAVFYHGTRASALPGILGEGLGRPGQPISLAAADVDNIASYRGLLNAGFRHEGIRRG